MVSILFRKLRRDMSRGRAQFIAVIVTTFLGITLFGASYDAFLNLKASYRELYARLRFADLTVRSARADEIAQAGAALDGVTGAATRIEADVPFRIGGRHKLLGRLISLPAPQRPEVNDVMVLRGAYLPSGEDDSVLVETHTADHFQLRPGDSLELLGPGGWQTLRVSGVAASPEYVWLARSRQEILTPPDDFGVVFVSPALARRLTGVEAPNAAMFTVVDEKALDKLAALASQMGAGEVFTKSEQASNAALNTDLEGFGELSFLFPILFLTAAGMTAYVLLTRIVNAQRPIIGMLMANGLRRRTVLAHYLSFGVIAGLGGALPGIVAGLLIARVVTRLYTSAISVPITVTVFHWVTPVTGIAFGLVAGALAALAPALAASRTSPAAAMRGATPSGRGRISILELIIPPLRRAPGRWKLVLRSVERNRRRTAYTALGVVLALTLILVSWGMLDTTNVLVADFFRTTQKQDAQVRLTSAADDAALDGLRAVPGVTRVEPLAEMPVAVLSGGEQYDTFLRGLLPETAMHDFKAPGGKTVALPAQGILAGAALRSALGVSEGQQVDLYLPSLNVRVREPIARFIDESMGTYIYISLPRLRELVAAAGAQKAPASAALLSYEPGADRETMRARLIALPEVAAFTDSQAMFDVIQSFMSLFYVVMGAMLAFGAVMAFALMFNTMAVNMAERAVEIAALRAEGMPFRDIARITAFENLFVILLGVAIGLPVGYGVAYGFMRSYSSDLFTFDLHMLPTTPVIAAVVVIAVALLSQVPGLRALGRINIAAVARERAL